MEINAHYKIDTRHAGGQYSLGLFGLPSGNADRRRPCPAAPATAKPSPIERRMADRRAAALATEDRLARLQARLDAPAPAKPSKPSLEGLSLLQRTSLRRETPGEITAKLARVNAALDTRLAQAAANLDRDALFADEEARPTWAMSRAAHAADMREVYHPFVDDEQADLARRACGAGYVEAAINGEGF